ncbi:MAG: ABC transporter substrate-binding protein [Chelatococcus sp.]|jgi:peptide/nickel transport system substrate-binding protein|nr:ABC transporter substrate-binding protein [Chelatococcus sp. HY11]MBX3542374.1 ABC transporter substrate-binding protein [Chelatococcus sp.]CAH1656092.1 Oligopeptide-binding protein AppA [Hyphomicrobiales bacterium]CAH1695735.1 Oligopeptide-binding protein AppA [Hyphomicrobiales bacterium]
MVASVDTIGQINRRSLLLGSVLIAASGPAWAATQTPKQGGKLTMLLNWEPTALVSLTTSSGAEGTVSPKVHEGLLAYDFDINPRPQLAKEWSVSPDGKEYIFKLREGVHWHDGKEFTSADVKTSLEILKQRHPRGRATFANVDEIVTPDAHTVVLRLSKPAPYLLYALSAAESPIVAHHLYGGVDPQANPANAKPIGTGPFKFKEWARGSFIRYERNPDYWDKPKPYIDELVVRLIPDPSARTVAFEVGEIDLGGENPIPFTDVDRLKAMPQFVVETQGYSYSPEQIVVEFNLDRPQLQNPLVRQAIAHAIDRQVVLDVVWSGYGVIAPSPISPHLTRFYAPGVETYPFDLKKAAVLLDEAGLKPGAGGTRLSLTFDYPTSTAQFAGLGNYLKQSLRKIGIDLTLRGQELSAFSKRIYTDRDFDLSGVSLGNSFDPTVGVQRTYWSKNFKVGVPFSNGTHYNNPEVDALLEAAAVEPDAAKRVQEFKTFQEIVARDIPGINLITKTRVTVANKKVRNHTVTADGLRGNFADVFVAE